MRVQKEPTGIHEGTKAPPNSYVLWWGQFGVASEKILCSNQVGSWSWKFEVVQGYHAYRRTNEAEERLPRSFILRR